MPQNPVNQVGKAGIVLEYRRWRRLEEANGKYRVKVMTAGKSVLAKSLIRRPALAAAVMFVGFFVVGMVTIQRRYTLGVEAPRSAALAMGGFLSGAARVLGVSSLSRHGLSILYACAIVVLFAAYVWMLVLLARSGRGIGRAFIIGTSIAFCMWLLFTPPILAKDLYDYASYGRAIAVHCRNPYVVPPSAFPGDHLVKFMDVPGAVSVYGPLFNYLAALTTLIAGKSVVTNVIAFKLLTFIFFVGSLFVLDDLARRTKKDRRSFVLLALAWNPLLLIHVVGGGHNDAIMIFFILLGFLMYRKGSPVLALSSVMLAAMIKSTAALVLIPMLVLFVRENAKRELRQYVLAAVALVGIPLVLYLPYWPGLSGLKKTLTVASGFSGAGIPYLLSRVLGLFKWGGGDVGPHSLVRKVALGISLVFFLALFVYFCSRVRDYRSLLYYSGAIALAFLFTTSWLMAWYGGFVVVLVALSGSLLMIWAGVASTFVLSFYGRHMMPVDIRVTPVSLLVIALLLLYFLRKRKLASSRSG
jgi:hypothetical protein